MLGWARLGARGRRFRGRLVPPKQSDPLGSIGRCTYRRDQEPRLRRLPCWYPVVC